MKSSCSTCLALLVSLLLLPIAVPAQKDPGPRTGAPGAGGPYLTLNANELSFFSHAFLRFAKPVSVSGTIEKGKGLGPTFNGNDCAMCHAQPTAGGSSPGLMAPDEPHPNPQVALATLDDLSLALRCERPAGTGLLPPLVSIVDIRSGAVPLMVMSVNPEGAHAPAGSPWGRCSRSRCQAIGCQ